MTMVLTVICSCAAALGRDTSQDADEKRSLSSYYQAPQLSPDTAVRHLIPGRDQFQVKYTFGQRRNQNILLTGVFVSRLLLYKVELLQFAITNTTRSSATAEGPRDKLC